jgi:hypothetical protein
MVDEKVTQPSTGAYGVKAVFLFDSTDGSW